MMLHELCAKKGIKLEPVAGNKLTVDGQVQSAGVYMYIGCCDVTKFDSYQCQSCCRTSLFLLQLEDNILPIARC